jgi:hypothetical protein
MPVELSAGAPNQANPLLKQASKKQSTERRKAQAEAELREARARNAGAVVSDSGGTVPGVAIAVRRLPILRDGRFYWPGRDLIAHQVEIISAH